MLSNIGKLYIKRKEISRSFSLRLCVYNTDIRRRDFALDLARGRLTSQNALKKVGSPTAKI